MKTKSNFKLNKKEWIFLDIKKNNKANRDKNQKNINPNCK